MRRKIRISGSLFAAVIALAGCNKTRDAFGLNRHQPDEFTTPPREVLAAPASPDLPRPQPGAPDRGVIAADIKARQILMNTPLGSTADDSILSSPERIILEKAEVSKVDTGIRQTIQQEAVQNNKGKTLVHEVLFWQKPQDSSAQVINPVEERKKYEIKSQESNYDD